jgi:hypothetical protein
VRVLGVERTPVRRVPVYNFGVAGTRTYFVGDMGLADPVPVWVHNVNTEKVPEGGADKTPGRAVRNPADDKKLSNGEIKKLLDNKIDPHNLKPNSKYDLFKDKDGNIWVKPKDGGLPPENWPRCYESPDRL